MCFRFGVCFFTENYLITKFDAKCTYGIWIQSDFFLGDVSFPGPLRNWWKRRKLQSRKQSRKGLKAFHWRDYWQRSSACVVSSGDSSFGEEEVGEEEDMGIRQRETTWCLVFCSSVEFCRLHIQKRKLPIRRLY